MFRPLDDMAVLDPAHTSLYASTSTPRVLASTTAILLLATGTFLMRLYSRMIIHKNAWWDDWIMALALAITIVNFALSVAEQVRTGGRHVAVVKPDDIAFAVKLSYIGIFLWGWAVCITKMSVCMSLYRIKNSRGWKIGYAVMIFSQFACGITLIITVLVQCSPIEANWNMMLPERKCWSPKKTSIVVYTNSTIYVVTDIACALLPLIFIRQVKRPLREKITLAIVLGLGLAASGLGIVKVWSIAIMTNEPNSTDPLWQSADTFIYSFAEQGIGIAAANIPCAKAMLDRLFVKFGGRIITQRGATEDSSRGNFSNVARLNEVTNDSRDGSDDMGTMDTSRAGDKKEKEADISIV